MERFAVAERFLESVTCTVKFVIPAAVGVPLIIPVESFSASPAGKLPLEIAQEYGGVPPVAARVVVYAVFICPPGKVVVETASVPARPVTANP
jgi:hypothetical protein